MRLPLKAILWLIAFLPWTVYADTHSALVTWSAPIQNTDGSPLTNLSGFRVWRGPDPTHLQGIATVTANILSYFEVPPPGIYYYAVSTLTSAGAESAQSAAVQKVIRLSAPHGGVVLPAPKGGVVLPNQH